MMIIDLLRLAMPALIWLRNDGRILWRYDLQSRREPSLVIASSKKHNSDDLRSLFDVQSFFGKKQGEARPGSH